MNPGRTLNLLRWSIRIMCGFRCVFSQSLHLDTSWYIKRYMWSSAVLFAGWPSFTISLKKVMRSPAGVAVQTSPISHLAVQAFCDGYLVSPWWPTPGIVFVGLPTPVVTGLSPSQLSLHRPLREFIPTCNLGCNMLSHLRFLGWATK